MQKAKTYEIMLKIRKDLDRVLVMTGNILNLI
jgi:hypothetical protein